LGEQLAAQLHAAMVTHAIAMASQSDAQDIQLWCTPTTDHPLFVQLHATYGVSLHAQSGSDLGQRMLQAFERTLQDHQAAVIIGTDCPAITPALLKEAFSALDSGNDVVIAPAEDGGYVLLGLRKASAQLFTGINWGTEQVYQQTVQQLLQSHFVWKALACQWDVDRPEDLNRLIDAVGSHWHKQLRLLIDAICGNN
jgi:rSAM/selenodomain-associated transferase 1